MTLESSPSPAAPFSGAATRSGIRARLILLAVAAMLPVALAQLWTLRRERAATEARARREVEVTALGMASLFDEHFATVHAALTALASAVEPEARLTARNDSILRAAAAALRPRHQLHLTLQDADDRNVGATRVPPGGRALIRNAGRAYYEDARATGGFTIGDVRRSVAGDWVLQLAQGIRRNGHTTGVLVAGLRADSVVMLLKDAKMPPWAIVTLVDETGHVIGRTKDPARWMGVQVSSPDSQAHLRRNPVPTETVQSLDGTRVIMASIPLHAVPWMLYVSMPEELAFADANRSAQRAILATLASFAIAILLSWLAARRIVHPLSMLRRDAAVLAGGDLSHRSSVTTRDELGELALSLNTMALTLQVRERELRENEARYHTVFDGSPLPMWVIDRATHEFLEVNAAAVQKYGWTRDEFLGLTALDVRPAAEHARFLRAMHEAPEPRGSIWSHVTKDGRQLEVEISAADFRYAGRPAVLSVINDVTARRREQRALDESREQLRHMQKIEAVGTLAAGIAHDFNNLLTAMLGHCDLALALMTPDDPSRSEIEAMRETALRAATLTRRLLSFSRQQPTNPVLMPWTAAVGGMGELLRRTIGEHVRLELDLDPSAGMVRADVGQLEQLLLNLVVNARDAMPEGGQLTVRTTRSGLAGVSVTEPLPAGDWALLIVSDTGSGMSDEVRRQIFEPFFTTKPAGRGTGLGLPTVLSIVQRAEGHLRVRSSPGHGTTFVIALPRVADEALGDQDARRRPAAAMHGGTATILLVEDDAGVRSIGRRLLESFGYRVLVAEHADGALQLLRDQRESPDLLFTDVVMPGMNGRELADIVRREHPGIRILFTSGYTDDVVLLQRIAESRVPFLRKPFTAESLAEAVSNALSE